MTELKNSLIERLREIGCPVLYFDGVCTTDMTKGELGLLCSWLGHQLLSKDSVIEISVKNENQNSR